jgi:hypothetical protein
MRRLLDTCLLLRAAAEPENILIPVCDRIMSLANNVLFSAVSI